MIGKKGNKRWNNPIVTINSSFYLHARSSDLGEVKLFMRHKANELWLNIILVLCWEFAKQNTQQNTENTDEILNSFLLHFLCDIYRVLSFLRT